MIETSLLAGGAPGVIAETEKRREFALALREVFAEKTTSREYLAAVVKLIRNWSGCDAVGIRVVNESRDIPYEAWEGFKPEFIEKEHSLSLNRDACCCIRAVTGCYEPQDKALLTVGGSYACADSAAFLGALPPALQARYRGNCLRFGYRSVAIIPVQSGKDSLGVVHLADPREGVFTPAFVEFIESLTPVIGEAIRRFRAEKELARFNAALQSEIAQRQEAERAHREVLRRLSEAEENERGRISRELHDRLGQDFTAMKLGLELISRQGAFAPEVNDHLTRLQKLADGLITHVHRLAWELHPPALDDLGLELALSRYVSEWSQTSLVPVDFHSGLSGERLPMDLETTLFRVTQETLTNVARHARARRVSVLLERRQDHVSLIVEDDGQGFDAEAVLNQPGTQGKLGLLGMQERVRLAGGTWDVESTPGVGTSVFVRLPIPISKARAT